MTAKEYNYEGLNRKGKAIHGSITANSPEEARASLQALGYQIRGIKPIQLDLPRQESAHLRSSYRLVAWALVIVCLLGWAGWASLEPEKVGKRVNPISRPRRLHLQCAVPTGRLTSKDRLEFDFPEIPLRVIRDFQKLEQEGPVRLDLAVTSSRKVTRCVVRCRRLQFRTQVVVTED